MVVARKERLGIVRTLLSGHVVAHLVSDGWSFLVELAGTQDTPLDQVCGRTGVRYHSLYFSDNKAPCTMLLAWTRTGGLSFTNWFIRERFWICSLAASS
jgi:hypothetical protein